MRLISGIILICFSLLLKAPVLFGADVDQKFRNDHRIYFDSDLDCDGQDELVSFTQDEQQKTVIYNKKGKKYVPVKYKDEMNLPPEVHSSSLKWFLIDSSECRLLVTVAGLWKYMEGKSYNLGNAVLVYQYKKKKLSIIKRYISLYDPEKEDQDVPETPLTRNPIEVVIKSSGNNAVLIQGYGYLYLINNSGEMINLNTKVPDNTMISAFDYNGTDLKVLLRVGNKLEYYFWDIRDDKLSEPLVADFKCPCEQRFEGDKLIFDVKKDEKKVKIIYSIQDGAITKESETVQE